MSEFIYLGSNRYCAAQFFEHFFCNVKPQTSPLTFFCCPVKHLENLWQIVFMDTNSVVLNVNGGTEWGNGSKDPNETIVLRLIMILDGIRDKIGHDDE